MLEDISAYANVVFEDRTIDWTLAHAWDSPIPAESRDTVVGEFTDRSLRGTLFVSDTGQNMYLGWGYNLAHSNLGGASFLRKDRTGAVTGAWAANAPDDQKPDDFGGNVFGADLGLMWLTHEPISSDTRRNRVYIGLLRDVVLVPYPAGVPQVGGAVPREAFGGSPAPAPTPTPGSDPQAVAEAVLATLLSDTNYRLLLQRYAKNGAREALALERNEGGVLNSLASIPGVHATVGEVLSGFNFHDGSPAATTLFNRINETVYQVLHDNGLIPPKP